jgi:hypothetical protein
MSFAGEEEREFLMAQSRRERLERQKERQRELRAAAREKRRPSRDDVARALLHFAITENIRQGRERQLADLEDRIVAVLTSQGFDRRETEAVLEALIDKYRSGWAFQRKRRVQDDGRTAFVDGSGDNAD